jgi:hypothetical protein
MVPTRRPTKLRRESWADASDGDLSADEGLSASPQPVVSTETNIFADLEELFGPLEDTPTTAQAPPHGSTHRQRNDSIATQTVAEVEHNAGFYFKKPAECSEELCEQALLILPGNETQATQRAPPHGSSHRQRNDSIATQTVAEVEHDAGFYFKKPAECSEELCEQAEDASECAEGEVEEDPDEMWETPLTQAERTSLCAACLVFDELLFCDNIKVPAETLLEGVGPVRAEIKEILEVAMVEFNAWQSMSPEQVNRMGHRMKLDGKHQIAQDTFDYLGTNRGYSKLWKTLGEEAAPYREHHIVAEMEHTAQTCNFIQLKKAVEGYVKRTHPTNASAWARRKRNSHIMGIALACAVAEEAACRQPSAKRGEHSDARSDTDITEDAAELDGEDQDLDDDCE